MRYSIDEVNNELEDKIFVNDEKINKKIGRIKGGDFIIINKNDDDNIKKIIKKFESNYLDHNKKTLIYNANNNIKIENYIYAATMDKTVPNDLYSDVIEKHYDNWLLYKNILRNKPLFIFNSESNWIHNEINKIKDEMGNIELLIVIDDDFSSVNLDSYHYYSYISAVIMITDTKNKLEINHNYKNIRYVDDEYE